MTASRSTWTGIAFGLCLAYYAAYQQFKLPPALPVLLQTYGYDRALAGGFMSVYAAAGLVLSLPLARVLERIGFLAPILTALALMIAGTTLNLMVPENGWVVLAGRGLEGIGFAVLAIAGPVLANANATGRQLPIVAGLMASWIPIGQLGATAAAPAAFAGPGWQALWWLGIAGALAMALWTAALHSQRCVVFVSPPATGGQISAVRRRGSLILTAGAFMIFSGQYYAYMTWLPQYLVEAHGLSPSLAVVGYTIPVATLIVTNLIFAMILRAGIPLGPLLAVGMASQSAVWWLMPVTGGDLAGIVSLVVYGIGAGIVPTCLFAVPGLLAGTGRPPASAFGAIMTGRNLGVLTGPVLLALVFKSSGNWDVAAPIFGTATTIGLAVCIWLSVVLAGARYTKDR
ncbi:MAG: MFS transporter [Alphaproteobacteria bacterium]|nr:MFS transporter [Alphaproteobacteria bacterium]